MKTIVFAALTLFAAAPLLAQSPKPKPIASDVFFDRLQTEAQAYYQQQIQMINAMGGIVENADMGTKLKAITDNALKRIQQVPPCDCEEMELRKSLIRIVQNDQTSLAPPSAEVLKREVGCTDCFAATEWRSQQSAKIGERQLNEAQIWRENAVLFAQANDLEIDFAGFDAHLAAYTRYLPATAYLRSAVLAQRLSTEAFILTTRALNKKQVLAARAELAQADSLIALSEARLKALPPHEWDTNQDLYKVVAENIRNQRERELPLLRKALECFDEKGQLIEGKASVYNQHMQQFNKNNQASAQRLMQSLSAFMQRSVEKSGLAPK